MKGTIYYLLFLFFIFSCGKKSTLKSPKNIEGTWKMIYAEIVENDSVKLKDLSNTTFIKIINKTHFSFFNQEIKGNKNFYSGAGSYVLEGEKYTETLAFTTIEAIKDHQFSFKVIIKGDTLIQSGIEKVKAAGINRFIIEKYIKLNK
ncbi:hypothetical protein [Tenacibaculum ovolyticum]|uniref:hypothetical protein n=1 Tax=Tenacibaculum ovolyticum TaxID=104270 RepID=UPI00048D6B0C|nr:hypothetical protein [Tenacibaculum ovolyticum]